MDMQTEIKKENIDKEEGLLGLPAVLERIPVSN